MHDVATTTSGVPSRAPRWGSSPRQMRNDCAVAACPCAHAPYSRLSSAPLLHCSSPRSPDHPTTRLPAHVPPMRGGVQVSNRCGCLGEQSTMRWCTTWRQQRQGCRRAAAMGQHAPRRTRYDQALSAPAFLGHAREQQPNPHTRLPSVTRLRPRRPPHLRHRSSPAWRRQQRHHDADVPALGRQHQHAATQRVGAHRLPLPLLLLLLLPQLLPPLLLLPLLPLLRRLRRLRRRQQRRDDRRVVLACRARQRKVAGRVGAGQRRTSSGDRVLWRYRNEQHLLLRQGVASSGATRPFPCWGTSAPSDHPIVPQPPPAPANTPCAARQGRVRHHAAAPFLLRRLRFSDRPAMSRPTAQLPPPAIKRTCAARAQRMEAQRPPACMHGWPRMEVRACMQARRSCSPIGSCCHAWQRWRPRCVMVRLGP